MFWDKLFGKKGGAELDLLDDPALGQGTDKIPEGAELKKAVNEFVDEAEARPLPSRKTVPNVFVADKKSGEYVHIDDYRNQEKASSSAAIQEIRAEMKKRMAAADDLPDMTASAETSSEEGLKEQEISNQEVIESILERQNKAKVEEESKYGSLKEDISKAYTFEALRQVISASDYPEKAKVIDLIGRAERAVISSFQEDGAFLGLSTDLVAQIPDMFNLPAKIREIASVVNQALRAKMAKGPTPKGTRVPTDEELLRSRVAAAENSQEMKSKRAVAEEQGAVFKRNLTAFAEEESRRRQEDEREAARKKEEESIKRSRHLDPDKVPFGGPKIDSKFGGMSDDDLIEHFHKTINAKEGAEIGSGDSVSEPTSAEKADVPGRPVELDEMKGEEKEIAKVDVESAFEKGFGLKAEDLNGIEGFKDLSSGQKLLVLENLRQMTLGKVKEGSEVEFEEATAAIKGSKKGFGRIAALAMNNLAKSFKVASAEKRLAKELMQGGIKEHGETLRLLIDGIKDCPEVLDKDGRPEIQFASLERWHGDDERLIAQGYNDAANAFMRLPKEWSYEDAPKDRRAEYERAEAAYKSARAEYLEMESRWFGEKWACQDLNSLEAKISLNQFLNQNPEAEQELLDISSKPEVWSGVLKSLKATRGQGISFAAGFAVRSLAVSTAGAAAGLIAAPLVGGFIGAWRGKEKADKDLKEQDKKARLGLGQLDEKAKNFVPSVHLIKRLQDLSSEYNEVLASGNEAKAAAIMMSLKARIDYSQEKIDKGLVDFGTVADYSQVSFQEQKEGVADKDRRQAVLGHQFELVQALSLARSLVFEVGLKAEDSQLRDRLDRVLESRNESIAAERRQYVRQQVKMGAIKCAGFALAGGIFRDVAGEWFGWDKGDGSVVLKAKDGLKEAAGGSFSAEGAELPDDFSQMNVGLDQEAPEVLVETAPDEAVVESAPQSAQSAPESRSFGGTSVWSEAERQVKDFLHKDEVSPADIDKVKDLVVKTPERYGLPADTDFNRMTAEQIKSIDWQLALADSTPKTEVAEGLYRINDGNLEVTEEFKKTFGGKASEPEFIKSLDESLKGLDSKGFVPMNKAGEVLPTEEATVAIGSAEHFKAFMEDPESKKLLSVISEKAKLCFDPKTTSAGKSAIFEELNRLKAPIEAELGGKVNFGQDGVVKVSLSDGSYRNLFSPDGQVGLKPEDVDFAKAFEDEPSPAKVVESAPEGKAKIEVSETKAKVSSPEEVKIGNEQGEPGNSSKAMNGQSAEKGANVDRPSTRNFKPLENAVTNGRGPVAEDVVDGGSQENAPTMTLAEAKNFDRPLTDPKLAKSLASQGRHVDLRQVPWVSMDVLKAWQDEDRTFSLMGLKPESLTAESAKAISSFKGRVMLSDDAVRKMDELLA